MYIKVNLRHRKLLNNRIISLLSCAFVFATIICYAQQEGDTNVAPLDFNRPHGWTRSSTSAEVYLLTKFITNKVLTVSIRIIPLHNEPVSKYISDDVKISREANLTVLEPRAVQFTNGEWVVVESQSKPSVSGESAQEKSKRYFHQDATGSILVEATATGLADIFSDAVAMQELSDFISGIKMNQKALEKIAQADAEASGLYQKALSYLNNGDFQKSLPLLEQVVRLLPENDARLADVYGNMAQAHLQMGNAEDTILYANKSLSIIPLNSPVILLLGEGYRLKKDYKAALSYYLKALRTDPGYFRAHGGFAQAYTEIGQEYGYTKGLVLKNIYHLEAYLTLMAENYDSYIKSHPDELNRLKGWIEIYDTYFSNVTGKEGYRLYFTQKDPIKMSSSDSEYKKFISIVAGKKGDDLLVNDILSISNIPENVLLKALESARKRIQLPL